ncbi:8831_t:CDS:2 [Entrophospora sp. SA101]|nr:8831_t:CDS:2 [Entrophospora sp. SA101]
MNSITSIQTTTTPKTISTVTTPQHKPPKLQPTPSPSLDDAIPTFNSYTGLSSPLLTPIETNGN